MTSHAPRFLPALATLAAAALAAPAFAQPAADAPSATPAASPAPARTLDAAALSERLGIRAVRLQPGERIDLDGTLSADAWQRAPAYDQFVEKDPVYGARPKYRTKVQVLHDDAALYVGVTAYDDHPEEIRAPLVRHDGVNRTQDFVVVYVDSIGKRQAAQFFRVNASGSLADGLHTAADDNEDFSPDFDFDAETARTPDGYTAVFRIPFSSLRFSSDVAAGWRIMVGRRVPRDQTYLWTSVPVPLDAPDFIATMQPLQELRPPEKPSFLVVRPSLTLRQSRTNDLGQPGTKENAADPSLDVKWHPMPELVVDGTWRPDFSQVALDVPQLSGNSSFALYLPEKRPFFFESADLLRSPTDALYTRSFTAPQWGLRGTWRGQREAGTAMVLSDKGGASTLIPGPYGTGSVAQPGSRSFIGRLGADLFGGNAFSVGAIASVRQYDGDRGDNDVVGPDFTWQATPAWKVRGQWLHSETSAQPAADTGTLAKGATRGGDLVVLKAVRNVENDNLELMVQDIGEGFRHDSGFFNQVGIREIDVHQGWAWRQLGPINELWFNLYANQIRDRSGDQPIVSDHLTPGVWLAGPNNIQASLQYRGLSRVRTEPGARLLSEHYWHGGFSMTPARWMPLLEANANLGRLADYTTPGGAIRRGGNADLSMRLRPHPRLEIEPSIWGGWLRGDGGGLQYREIATQLLGVWHLDAKQSLRVITQRYTYDVRPSTRVSSMVTSLTYAWRRSMGTVLYVGWTRGRELDCPVGEPDGGVAGACVRAVPPASPGTPGYVSRNAEAFVKLQVDLDEVRRMF